MTQFDLTLITATLNSGDTLACCLDSVKKQNIRVEHILVDGGSQDDTLAIANRNKKKLHCILPGPDNGLYDAMNKGIASSTAEIVGILNSDDFYPESNILTDVLTAFKDPEIDACYGDLVYVDSDKTGKLHRTRYWRAGDYTGPEMFYNGWMVPHPTLFIRRSVYKQYGVFNLGLGSAADYELMLRFFVKHKLNLVYIPRVLVHMRVGGVSNATLLNRLRAHRFDKKAWTVNKLSPRPWTLWFKPLRKLNQWFCTKAS